MKPLVLAIALAAALGAPAIPAAHAAPASPPVAATPALPAWVQASNAHAQVLIDAQARFAPEMFSFFGIPGHDTAVSDLGAGAPARFREATAAARDTLAARMEAERDPRVRQDLAILVQAADDAIASSELQERLVLPFADAPQLVFSGMQGLLSDQVPEARRAHARERLERYVGLAPGSTPVMEQARARYEKRAGDASLLRPARLEVEQALRNVDTYAEGIRALFAKYGIDGADAALDALDAQSKAYAAWMESTVLPAARTETQLPAELYALRLHEVGIDIDPQVLMQRAQLSFMETRAAMQQLAPLVAAAKGIDGGDDYIAVLRALKTDVIPNEALEARYREVIDAIDPIIRAERIVDVPNRPMQMRLGSAAESAAQPAPHFRPAPLVGNTGEQGTFVLPVGNPALGPEAAYDDFNHPAAAWTLSAHEGRPGHELQFTAMVERGISLARTLFAFNSVNVEGWALYAEAEMVPHEPVEGQFIALQFRLLRAARAMLDPMLNLGMVDRDRAMAVLVDDVGLSPAMARQEIDRYTFNAPGQAGAYFHGYTRILELRMETELALGERFDRLAFNNFLLDQGLLPPDQLAEAVRTQFVPAQQGG
jgi:uncharacterized protein (DUF885 family)